MGVCSLRDCGNSFVRRALIECSFSSFDKALSVVDQGLNEFPECGELYVVQVMAEKKLVDESQLQFASLIDFRSLGQSGAFRRALRFASPELRQLLRYYKRCNDELITNWYRSSHVKDPLPNSVTISPNRAVRVPGDYWGNRSWLNARYKPDLPKYISSRLLSRFGAEINVVCSIPPNWMLPEMTLSTDIHLSDPEVADMFPQLCLHSLADVPEGARDHIVFGGFLWQVLDVHDDSALLLSEHCVRKMDVGCEGWSDSLVRTWLNGEFYDSLDVESKDDVILRTGLETPNVRDGVVESHEESVDKVFLLSFEEMVRYLRDGKCGRKGRKTFNEEYRKAPRNERDNLLLPSCVAMFHSMSSGWLLRSGTVCQGADKSMEVINESGWYSTASQKQCLGIRPAMWVKLP